MKEKEKKDFFKRLCEILDEETQVWWTKKLGVSQGTISNFYRQRFTSVDKIFKIIREKKISADWLFFGTGPKYSKHLNSQEIDKVQDGFRASQNKIVALEHENMRLRKENRVLKAGIEQNEFLVGGDKEDRFLDTITYLRNAIDLIFKMALNYAEQEIDDDKYIDILNWLKSSHKAKMHNTASILEELSSVFLKK